MAIAELDKTHLLSAPGQGNQQIGMGAELAQRSEVAKDIWVTSSNALLNSGTFRFDFKERVWLGTINGRVVDTDPEKARKKADKWLTKTENAQPAIIIDGAARHGALEEYGLLGDPYFYAGYSLGFATILKAVGVLTTEAAVELGRGRGEAFKYAIKKSPKTTMLALIGVDENLREEAAKKYDLDTCLKSTDRQIVMGGRVGNIRRTVRYFEGKGVTKGVKSLEGMVDAAFHSRYFEDAVPLYERVVNELPLTTPENGALLGGSIEAKQLFTVDDIRKELISQLTHTENWADVIRMTWELGVRKMTELNNVSRLGNMHAEMLGGERPQRIATPSIGEGDRGVTIAQRWVAKAA